MGQPVIEAPARGGAGGVVLHPTGPGGGSPQEEALPSPQPRPPKGNCKVLLRPDSASTEDEEDLVPEVGKAQPLPQSSTWGVLLAAGEGPDKPSSEVLVADQGVGTWKEGGLEGVGDPHIVVSESVKGSRRSS
eukprot:13072402-Alexandrium_andersonii.AAC.1